MGVKYRLQGEDTLSREIRIDIGDDVYIGAMTTLPLISANLTREQGDGGILATSLSITAMSMQDGDCEALYVRDSTRWFVELYIDNVIKWRGYILRELKDTYYRNSPCEVKIKAVDGIAVLKEIKYRPSFNRISLWGILTWIATRTRLSCELCAMDNFVVEDLEKTEREQSWIASTYVNDGVFKDMTVYDMLAVMTENLCAYFTQVNGNFAFFRLDRTDTAQLGAISIKSTDNSWYYKTAPGKIGSMAADVDFSPVGTFVESVEPAKKYLPLTIERESVSALGVPSMLVSLPIWAKANTPVYFVHAAGSNRQLYLAHGQFKREIQLCAPGYPMKLKISGASLGRGKMTVSLRAGSNLFYDFDSKVTAEGENRWCKASTSGGTGGGVATDTTSLAIDHLFDGQLSLLAGHPTTNIPYNYYKVDKMETLELDIDALPADFVGSKTTIYLTITIDKAEEFASSEAYQKLHGVWVGDVTLESEAFEEQKGYVMLNDDAIDEAESFTMMIQESPDDNGSELFIPGVITYKDATPIHNVTTLNADGFTTMPFNELIARERGLQYKYDRVTLKGDIIGTDAFDRLLFYNADNTYIYLATKIDSDIINRIAAVELVQLHKATASMNYPITTEEEIEDDFDSIAEKEYRLKVEFTEATAKGGSLGKAVYLETYSFGVQVSRSALAANATTGYTMEILDAVTWARTRSNGIGITVDKQPLKAGGERACRVKVKYTIDGVEIFKIATFRQQANTYEVTSKALSSGTGLRAISADSMSADGKTFIIWKGGGGVSLDYGNYEYQESRTWASGDSEVATVYEPVRFELVDPWEGLELIEYNGIVQGIQSGEAAQQRLCTLRLSNAITGENVEEYIVHQFNLHKTVQRVSLLFANSADRLAPSSALDATLDNINNKGRLVLRFTPENTSEASTLDLQALNTAMTAVTTDNGRSYILTLRANAGSSSGAVKVTTESGLVQTLTIKYVYNS